MADDKITLPDAFSHCKEEARKCECKHDDQNGTSDSETISCVDAAKPAERCARDGCLCMLFRRGKSDKHKDDKWEFVPPRQHARTGEEPFETKKSDKYLYECYCVKPKLPAGYTLCACDSCQLNFGKGAHKDLIECAGTCFGGGKCHLFRIKHPERDKEGKEEWEHVTAPDSPNGMEKGYYYRCFCVKADG